MFGALVMEGTMYREHQDGVHGEAWEQGGACTCATRSLAVLSRHRALCGGVSEPKRALLAANAAFAGEGRGHVGPDLMYQLLKTHPPAGHSVDRRADLVLIIRVVAMGIVKREV